MSLKRSGDPIDSQSSKKVCRSYLNGGSGSVQLTLNQLMLSGKLNPIRRTTRIEVKSNDGNGGNSGQCSSCRSRCQSGHLSGINCNFCERLVCDECSLGCFRCGQAYCRLCAVKCYHLSHQNNIGVCLSCDP